MVLFMAAGQLTVQKYSWSMDMGDSLIKDYAVSLPIPKHRLELSLDYFRIDNSLDVFDVRKINESEKNEESEKYLFSDMSGFKAIVNYGLFDSSCLHSTYTYRTIEYGTGKLDINSVELSLKQNINNRPYGIMPYINIDAGFRWNRAKPPSAVSSSSWEDKSPYMRIIAGGIFGNVFPNFFIEYGYVQINSAIKPEYALSVQTDDTGVFNSQPIDTGRNENRIRTGISLLVKFPYTAMSCFSYEYIALLRDNDMGKPDDNHLLKADVSYFLSDNFILNIGHEYYYRQFNGVIPSLFNQFSQSSHIQRYYAARIGITVLFGGR